MMENMYSIEQVNEILNSIADNIPHKFYKGLNGGIILDEQIKYHDESVEDQPLIILGQYIRDRLGAKIKIYYGSLMQLYPFVSEQYLKDRLEEVLQHELLHHVEYMAGEYGLVIEDEEKLQRYRNEYKDR